METKVYYEVRFSCEGVNVVVKRGIANNTRHAELIATQFTSLPFDEDGKAKLNRYNQYDDNGRYIITEHYIKFGEGFWYLSIQKITD